MTARRQFSRAGLLLYSAIFTVALCLLALCVVVPARAVTRVAVERQVYLMGTRATLVTWALSRPAGVERLDELLTVLEKTEQELSTWRDTSLLTRVNRQATGEARDAPESLCQLFEELRLWHGETRGAFDPAVGSLVHAWGLREDGRVPPPAVLRDATARAGLEHFVVGSNPCTITRTRDATLDAGAFGKGVALDRLVRKTNRHADSEPWMVDLGGQVVVSGRPPAGTWPVSIGHPTRRHSPAVTIRLTHGSLAVSGGSERDRWVGDTRIGHVLDPRTGRPVVRSFTVAVWHPRALVADILSTALYVMGVSEGLAWAEERGAAVCFLIPVAAQSRPRSVFAWDSVSPGTDVELAVTEAFRRRFLE